MLPGVELARRRRLHQRAAAAGTSSDGAPCGPVRPDFPSAMGEAALLARTRLRERLRGGPDPTAAPTTTYSFTRGPDLLDRHPSSACGTADGDRRPRRHPKKKSHHGGIGNEGTRGDAAVDGPSSSSLAGAGASSSLRRGMRRDSAAEEVCAVCLDALRSQSQRRFLVNLPCSHNYHFDCVRPWLASDSRCPCCRKPVVSL